jgi:UDP-N-acetylmuramoylalanine--D-glutamate ligase
MRLKGKNVLVYGIAKSGIASANFLGKLGVNVFLFDDDKDVLKNLLGSDLISVEYDTIFDFNKDLLKFIDLIVISPSVSIHNKNLKLAILEGVRVISEIELGFLKCRGDVLAVTGTNGKTTTVRLIEHIFKEADKRASTVGNIGHAFTKDLTYEKKKPTYITEVSSFQLEAVHKFAPKICAILNITPDHLDRHFTFDNYKAEKAKIFKKMKKRDFVLLNYDDEGVRQLKEDVKAKVYYFSTRKTLERGMCIEGGNIVFCENDKQHFIMSAIDIKLKGEHNLSNVLCASLMCYLYGVKQEVIERAVSTFKGVAHRLEFVKKENGVSYYNDSKATNIDACLKAVNAFKSKVILILGGSSKGENYDELFKNLKNNIKKIIVNGDNADDIIISAKRLNFKSFFKVSTLKEAVKKASTIAREGEVVLLSPASASFDQFRDYKHRGEEFVELVESL